MPRSLVVYRGASAYDPDARIRAVLVLHSTNRKTGDMVQLHILPDIIPPHVAQRMALDFAVCGTCPLRPALGGGCYVTTCQGPNSTWKATRDTGLASAAEIAGALQGRTLRLGAYGDPAALPAWLVSWLARLTDGRVTGYTHGWRNRPDLAQWCMASVETAAQAADARSKGWRWFRARRPSDALIQGWEIQCPADRVSCADCLLCRGNTVEARSVTIEVHGSCAGKALRVVQ